jgi:hypothetical protein
MKTPAQRSRELEEAIERFVESFECMFSQEWNVTQCNMQSEHFIKPTGTFLYPGVDDESSNWGNRGGLLHDYRVLRKIMNKRGLGL